MATSINIDRREQLLVMENCNIWTVPLETEKEIFIGKENKHNSTNIIFTSSTISSEHGKILKLDESWFYIDGNEKGGSKNGTLFNGSDKEWRSSTGAYIPEILENGDVLGFKCKEKRLNLIVYLEKGQKINHWFVYPIKPTRFYIKDSGIEIRYTNNNYYIYPDFGQKIYLNGKIIKEPELLHYMDRIITCEFFVVFTKKELLCGEILNEKQEI
jgi:hypothetical protein